MRSWSYPSIVLGVGGELDLLTAPAFRDELIAFAGAVHAHELVLDLSDVEFMDSSGLKPLVEARDLLSARGRTLRLRGVPRAVTRLVRAVGLADILTVDDGVGIDHRLEPVVPVQRGRPGTEPHTAPF